MKQFTSVEETDILSGPAGVQLSTGKLYINPTKWNNLSPKTQRLILLHEQGHLMHGKNEFEADEHSFWKMLEFGEDSLNIVECFYKALPFSTTEQIQRAEAMLVEALEYESAQGNTNATNILGFAETGELPEDVCEFVGAIISGAVALLTTGAKMVSESIKDKKAREEREETQEKLDEEVAKGEEELRKAELERKREDALAREQAKAQVEAQQRAETIAAQQQEVAAEQAAAKKAKTTKTIIIVIVIAVLGFLAYKNKEKLTQILN